MLFGALAASAQETISTVRVSTNPPGIPFLVDGQTYMNTTTFMWPEGSKHVLTVGEVNDNVQLRTRYRFATWFAGETELKQKSSTVTITADPAIPYFRAEFKTEYLLKIGFFTCTEIPCQSPGSIVVDGERYTQSIETWKAEGSTVLLEAIPNAGYVFLDWHQDQNIISTGFLASVVMNAPRTITPRFELARQVRLQTNPAGLQLMADRATVVTPKTFEWGWNTTHTLGPVSPQFDDTGKVWIFKAWTDGGPALRAFKVQPSMETHVVTAEYVPGARVTLTTNPTGLKLLVDGKSAWNGAYSYSWAPGETHVVEAPAEQVDQSGRKWMLRGWSNGGTAVQEIAVTDAHTVEGLRLIADYELMGRLTVQSSAGAISATVDGAACPMPCTLHRAAGTEVRIAVPEAAPAGDGSRYQFQGWGDTAASERTVTFDSEIRVVTAAYQLMHQLTMAAEPAGGANWHCTPESADGFYGSGTTVAVEVEGRPGYRFSRFEGDLTGSFTSGTVTMSGPRYVQAVFEKVPYIAPAGVGNAAAETPVAGVAPGSIIAIYGANLAATTELGPDSPLVQTIGGVTVQIADRVLPLFFVSPEQINAQLPSGLEPGEYTLAVNHKGAEEVKATFTVVRNAPGLFQNLVNGKSYVVALHADGSAVTPESPAKRDEIVTIYGTGFGPYDRTTPDGFAVPASPVYQLVDPVEVVAGEAVFPPLWAGAQPGRIGLGTFRIRVATELPSGEVSLKLRVNGQDSNSVLIPIE